MPEETSAAQTTSTTLGHGRVAASVRARDWSQAPDYSQTAEKGDRCGKSIGPVQSTGSLVWFSLDLMRK